MNNLHNGERVGESAKLKRAPALPKRFAGPTKALSFHHL
jgi:hypothetical protein